MDDDIVPSSSYATTIPSSPPLDPRYRAVSPTSSEPPLFSSDDPPEAADISNYESPRYKRKRVGTWWETDAPRPVQERKKAKISRNFDSGVWLQSDGSESSQDISVSQIVSSDPVVPHRAPFPSSSFDALATHGPKDPSPAEAALRQIIQDNLERNSTSYLLDSLGLEDSELHFVGNLQQVIRTPLDAGVDIPAEGQYRSMVPELYVNLAENRLCHLTPALFDLQFLTSLVLRDNQIQELPPQLGNLRNLKELDLSRNRLRWLPREVLELIPPDGASTGLKRLQLMGNPVLEAYDLYPLVAGDNLKMPGTGELVTHDIPRLYELIPSCQPSQMLVQWIRLQETLQAHTPSPRDQDAIQIPLLIARLPVVYYDQMGRIAKGSTIIPIPGQADFSVIIDTKRGSYGAPSTWFEPPHRTCASSLAKTSMHNLLRKTSIEYVWDYFGDDAPLEVETMLSRAQDNEASVYSALRECHMCRKAYVMPAAEWIEFWNLPFGHLLPVMSRVCSWGCVPDEYAKRPKEL